jgi:uncharacterized protein (TIGR03000 family)
MYSFLLFTALSSSLAAPAERPKVDSAAEPAPATIRVHLPADAKLYFDGEATHSNSSVREFETPLLEPGKTYCYQIVGKVVRDGRTITARKEVDLRAGEVTEVTLNLPKPKRPPVPATIVVHLPVDARLTVDGEPIRFGGSVRQFESPPLSVGKTYSYMVVGTVIRDGRAVTARKEIDVRADEVTEVTLNLPDAPAIYTPADGGSVYYPSLGGSTSYSAQGGTSYSAQGGTSYSAQGGTTVGGVGGGGFSGGGYSGGGFAGGGFAGGGGFSGGGMPYTSGGGGNTGPGSYALINGQKVFIPAGTHLNQMHPQGGMMPGGFRPSPGGFRSGGFGGHTGGGGRRGP